MFVWEPEVEIAMLFNILGWEIQDIDLKFNFSKIIFEAKDMKDSKEESLQELQKLLKNDWELNHMEVDITEEKMNSEEMEEEKVVMEDNYEIMAIKVTDKTLIPTNLYLLTPDYYFTLLPLDKTLAKLTKKYYKKNCSLCQKITKRGAICLSCGNYMWVSSWEEIKLGGVRPTGNLTVHSNKCGGGASAFIGPIEGQIIYVYNGLAVESKSPFVDKYGECYDPHDKRFDSHTLKEAHYNEVRGNYMNFNISNTVITKRGNKTRVYLRNVL